MPNDACVNFTVLIVDMSLFGDMKVVGNLLDRTNVSFSWAINKMARLVARIKILPGQLGN